MNLSQNFFYALLGPFWPEYLIAKELRRKGWKVFRQFNVYNPRKKEYAEIDILAVSNDGFIIVEVKSWQGAWESYDYLSKPYWKKALSRRLVKSPVWQVKRARLALIETLLEAYPHMRENKKILNFSQTYVFLDRGTLVNGDAIDVQKAWKDMQVKVLPLSYRSTLPVSSNPGALAFVRWLEAYHKHFKWRIYFRVLQRLNLLNKYLWRLEKTKPLPSN